MIQHFKKAWAAFVLPLLQRPKGLQVAALCYRHVGNSKEVLLITSRDTGRWVIPKGWPMRGLGSLQSAMQEAWEEAGVLKGRWGEAPIGTYTYDKVKSTGWEQPVEILVYPVAVDALADTFPESDQRKRQWFAPKEAAELVNEPQLQAILRAF